MELTTFSAILTHAIGLEGQVQAFYEQAAQVIGETELRALFASLAQKSAKRQRRMLQVRQDNITEMVLEPITGLSSEDYALNARVEASPPNGLRAQAAGLERQVLNFYRDTGPKLGVTEAIRAFERHAKESAERLEMLGG